MSIIMHSENPNVPREVLDYAYRRLDESGDTVVIYRKMVLPKEYIYIATGTDSDKPEGFTVFTALGAGSPLYDRLPNK